MFQRTAFVDGDEFHVTDAERATAQFFRAKDDVGVGVGVVVVVVVVVLQCLLLQMQRSAKRSRVWRRRSCHTHRERKATEVLGSCGRHPPF